MLWSLLTTLAVAGIHGAATAASTAGPSACVAFDINWNLLAFGFNGKDYNAGTQDTWTGSGTATDITTSGRPPFNSVNTTCYLSEFTNAIYVLNADTANPSAIYIYDATTKSWSMQAVTTGNFDPTNFATILDHDSNFFYAYSNGNIYNLNMSLLKAATSSPLPWSDVQSPDLTADANGVVTPGAGTAGYQPVLALAQNHVHFLGISGLPAGDAKIFVIHFSYVQPTPQNYGNFPSTHGKAASFFLNTGVQQEFAFIPDDGSATYVINVETNTTKTLSGPPTADPFATYYASLTALVQLTTSGTVSFLADANSSTSGGTWATVSTLPSALGALSPAGGSSSGAAGAAGSNSSSSSTGKASSTGSSSSSGSSASPSAKSSAASGLRMGVHSLAGILLATLLAALGVLML